MKADEGKLMILLKKINQQDIIVNCELIQKIEFSPHAVIYLTTGEKVIVAEGPDEIIQKVIEYRRAVNGRRDFSQVEP